MLVSCVLDDIESKKLVKMVWKSYARIAAFIGKLQHFKNLKLLYLSTCKWAISPFLSDQVTYATEFSTDWLIDLLTSTTN